MYIQLLSIQLANMQVPNSLTMRIKTVKMPVSRKFVPMKITNHMVFYDSIFMQCVWNQILFECRIHAPKFKVHILFEYNIHTIC